MKKIDLVDHFISLAEAKTRLLTAFEQKYGKDFVYSRQIDFEFDEKNLSEMYAILNAYLFNNSLDRKKLGTYYCSINDLRTLKKQLNINDPHDIYYAAYVPEVDIRTNKLIKESIFFTDEYSKKTFLFAVSCLCHEMIHQYDAHYGILIDLLKSNKNKNIDQSHQTPVFVKYMQFAALEGIRVMTNSNNTPYDILNQEAVQFTLNLQESVDENFQRLVAKLKAGEKIPNICLTSRDTVAFWIP